MRTPRKALAAFSLLVFAFPAALAQEAASEAEKEAAPAEEADEAEPAAPESAATEDGIRIAAMAVCLDIENRVPVGESEFFSSEVGRLYCFTAVHGADPPTQVFHRWYVGDRLINEIPINVKGERWRCWSRKTILPRWKGECRVEVLTEEGDVLGVREFTLE